MDSETKTKIKDLLRVKIEGKLVNYERETSSMPFLAKIMQDSKKVAAYSFIHSLATSLGMSIYEQIAKIIAESKYDKVITSYDVVGEISNEENMIVSKIMQEIKNKTRKANKEEEIKEILKCEKKEGRKIKVRADLFLEKEGKEYYFEIKTAKPNIDVFSKSKQKLLEWVALRNKKIVSALAIPYNPYHPKPYDRFTIQGVLDIKEELYVAEDFWDLLGGSGTYKELLKIFDQVGKELKEKIQKKIEDVATKKMEI